MKSRVSSLIVLLIVLVCASGCLGPKPMVRDFTATPPAPGSGEPYRVEAVIANDGPGEGAVEVKVDITNKQNGEIIGQDSKDVEMRKGETQHVLFEIDLPPSAQNLDAQSIEVDVEAHYPVE